MGFLTRCKRPFLFAFLLQFCNMLFSFFLKTFLILFEKQQQEYAANAALTASVGMLYEETRKVSGDDKGSVLQTQWSEFLSRGNIIDNSADAYNEQARAAQKKLSGFPASLIAGLTGAQAEEFSA